jgi:hypothetical protein
MRVAQPPGRRGSLKWLQLAVNRRPDLLLHPATGPVGWLSPLKADGYAEYRDHAFLRLIGYEHLSDDLAAFWPARGPQWDALGMAGETVVLVEAKAHIAEMLSSPCAAGTASLARIKAALDSVRLTLGARAGADWSTSFYQLANRLAHLYFLRRCGVDARLLLVGFVGDRDMGGPRSAAEWNVAYQVANYAMGLSPTHALSPFIHHIHPDTAILAEVTRL